MRLDFGGNASLLLSPGHVLYVLIAGAENSTKYTPPPTPQNKTIPAREVLIGDWVWSGTGKILRVVNISLERARGLYNPHTLDGDIVVNGIVTTVYTDAIRPDLAHAMLAPLRALYGLV